jgi:hypothetical protein
MPKPELPVKDYPDLIFADGDFECINPLWGWFASAKCFCWSKQTLRSVFYLLMRCGCNKEWILNSLDSKGRCLLHMTIDGKRNRSNESRDAALRIAEILLSRPKLNIGRLNFNPTVTNGLCPCSICILIDLVKDGDHPVLLQILQQIPSQRIMDLMMCPHVALARVARYSGDKAVSFFLRIVDKCTSTFQQDLAESECLLIRERMWRLASALVANCAYSDQRWALLTTTAFGHMCIRSTDDECQEHLSPLTVFLREQHPIEIADARGAWLVMNLSASHLNQYTPSGWPPLLLAAHYGYTSVVQAFLRRHEEVDFGLRRIVNNVVDDDDKDVVAVHALSLPSKDLQYSDSTAADWLAASTSSASKLVTELRAMERWHEKELPPRKADVTAKFLLSYPRFPSGIVKEVLLYARWPVPDVWPVLSTSSHLECNSLVECDVTDDKEIVAGGKRKIISNDHPWSKRARMLR